MSPRYTALSGKQKHKVLLKFLRKLMRKCFRELWVVIIDDIQYGDNDSMQLFHTITKQNTILFVLSLGRQLNSEYEINLEVLERARVRALKQN